jgi:glycerol uptake facilitator-like aquaporin
VTWAFALRRVFPWRLLLAYWIAEMAGAFLAVCLLRAMLGNVAGLGAPSAEHGAWMALLMETVATTFLVSVILGTATHHSVVGSSAALAVGGTVATCGLFARPISGAAMNPARALAPLFLAGDLRNAWVYAAGPLLGAAIAVGLAWIIHGDRRAREREAAKGRLGAASTP